MKPSEVMDINARTRKGPAKLRSLEIEHAENGGHIVTHRFHSTDGPYQEPKAHVFGKGQGKEMLSHIGKHMGLKADEVEPDEDSAAGAAT
jgi:hypothetical protein